MLPTFQTYNNVVLPDLTFIAGSYKRLDFYLVSASGIAISGSSISVKWLLSPYNVPGYCIMNKSFTFSSNHYVLTLLSTETSTLSGKYIQMPYISGSTGHDYRLAQGIVNIIAAGG